MIESLPGDVQESIHFVKYKSDEGSIYIFADDTKPRYITATLPLDYDTLAGADKFGNVFINRLPQDVARTWMMIRPVVRIFTHRVC